jgi:glutathione-specific gamma-glutamylcyclotransferase
LIGPLRLTADHVALVTRPCTDQGPWQNLPVFDEAAYEVHLAEFLAERPEGPVFVFAYGSLIWKPVFEPVAMARATAQGWHRRFCLKIYRHRGSHDQPGLMMQLDRGGSTEGMLQQIDETRLRADLFALWQREMTYKPPSNLPRWIDVERDGKALKAIAFTANHDSPFYAGHLPVETVAETLAEACGHWGSCAEYVLQTVTALQAAGIHDAYLWDIQERVALSIEARCGSSRDMRLAKSQIRTA